MNLVVRNLLCGSALLAAMAACTTSPLLPEPAPVQPVPLAQRNPSLRIAVLDNQLLGDLTDPAVMAKYARADLLVTEPGQFWNRPESAQKLALIRAANPDLKVIGFFRSKCVRQEWSGYDPQANSFEYALYQSAKPFLSYTTEGDTLQDWPGVAVFDFTNEAARHALIDVFAGFQAQSEAKLDGIYWDYFSPYLWISPDVTTMNGEPDMDGDGVAHLVDADEIASFNAAQEAWIGELRARMGDDFVQVANGARALVDSTFAGLLDGMNYEIFPNIGFSGGTPYRSALDPAVPNNLWAARGWLRTANGGPWQILDNVWIPRMTDQYGAVRAIDLGDVNRAIALLTGATVVHFDLSGLHRPGIPDVEINIGAPLGGVVFDGDRITRTFERGSVTVTMGSGSYPLGLSYMVTGTDPAGGDVVIEELRPGYMYP